jgi:nucleoside-diphosphate-sugar epimerase
MALRASQMNYLLGSHGRLGSAIISAFPNGHITSLDRGVYANWSANGAAHHISRYFENSSDSDSIVFVAAGLINPSAPADDHHRVNFLLPRNIVEGATRVGLRVVTFGTVMEKIVANSTPNPYLLSKLKLGQFISEFSKNSDRALHIRIHTLYGGGLPDSFMFLGQLFHALASQTPFSMSSGNQLREYHHIDDEIAAISALVHAKISGAVDLSHGDAVSLRKLATYVFDEFDLGNLLKIGALPNPANDNYGNVFERSATLKDVAFRDTLPSIVEYLRSCKARLGVAK